MLRTRERRNSLDAKEYQEAPAISNFILLVHTAPGGLPKKSHFQRGLIRSNGREVVIPNNKSVSLSNLEKMLTLIVYPPQKPFHILALFDPSAEMK